MSGGFVCLLYLSRKQWAADRIQFSLIMVPPQKASPKALFLNRKATWYGTSLYRVRVPPMMKGIFVTFFLSFKGNEYPDEKTDMRTSNETK